jgi:hypothetical protein
VTENNECGKPDEDWKQLHLANLAVLGTHALPPYCFQQTVA